MEAPPQDATQRAAPPPGMDEGLRPVLLSDGSSAACQVSFGYGRRGWFTLGCDAGVLCPTLRAWEGKMMSTNLAGQAIDCLR